MTNNCKLWMMYFIVKHVCIHHMCMYLNHFCNCIVITYATNGMLNHVLSRGSTVVILPTNDHVHQKMSHKSMIVIH